MVKEQKCMLGFMKCFKALSHLHRIKRKNYQIRSSKYCSKLVKRRKGNGRQCLFKLTKRRRCKRDLFPTIFSLPNELITEVLARVAANSFYDFFDVKLSCKLFHQFADDDYVLQHISLEKFPVKPWCSAKQAFFLEKCKKCGHPEALFREGLVSYFSYAKVEEGLNHLYNAAKTGHVGACYVLGVILLCTEKPEQNQEGKQLLKYVKSRKGTTESRNKLKGVTRQIWLRNLLEPKPNCCPMREQHRKKQGWPSDNNEDDMDCEACSCDLEVIFVCNVLRGIGGS